MAKRPAYQWYPGDARRDTALQSCSLCARGLWREMMDLMHDGEPYGHLTAGGVLITLEALARLVGEPAAKVRVWFAELDDRKVFSRTTDGVVFSRRMVKDEELRALRAAAGSKSAGNPNVPRAKGGKDRVEDILPDTLAPHPSGGPLQFAVAVAVEQQEQHSVFANANPDAGRRWLESPTSGEQPAEPEPTRGELIAKARKHGFNADGTDADIIDILIRKGVPKKNIAIGIEGLALLVKSGGYPKPGEGLLSMRMLYSNKHGKQLPVWTRAEDAYWKADEKKKPVTLAHL